MGGEPPADLGAWPFFAGCRTVWSRKANAFGGFTPTRRGRRSRKEPRTKEGKGVWEIYLEPSRDPSEALPP
jgi:hypothetical protein